MVRIWKPSSVAKAMENAHYAEEHMNLTGGTRPTFLHRPGFVGKAPRSFPREGAQGHPHMVIDSHQGYKTQGFQWQEVQHLIHHQ